MSWDGNLSLVFFSMAEVNVVEAKASPKVLLVEDEAALRFVTSEYLVDDGGFIVIEAKSADEAVDILESTDDIQCVFTDVRMPGRFDGLDLTRHVKDRYPDLPILMTSGNLQPSEMVAGVPFVVKPYDLQQLSVTIREMIGRINPSAV